MACMEEEPKLEIKKKLRGHSKYIQSIQYFSEFNWVISASGRSHRPFAGSSVGVENETIIIWDFESGEILEKNNRNSADVNGILKWNEEILFSCSQAKELMAFQLHKKKPHMRLLKEFKCSASCFRMMKITEDLLLVTCYNSLSILSFSKNAFVKTLNKSNLKVSGFDWWTKPVMSINYPSTFYANAKKGSDLLEFECPVVAMIDIDKPDFVVREFPTNVGTRMIAIIEVFKNHEGKEILLIGVLSRSTRAAGNMFLLFDTSIKDNNSPNNNIPIHRVEYDQSFVSSIISSLSQNYLCVCGHKYILLFELNTRRNKPVLLRDTFEAHGDDIYAICEVSRTRNSAMIASGGYDNILIFSEISNINLISLDEVQSEGDLRERIEFLRNEENLVLFCFDSENEYVVSVVLPQISFQNILKVFLL